jgi:hypothetical protein
MRCTWIYFCISLHTFISSQASVLHLFIVFEGLCRAQVLLLIRQHAVVDYMMLSIVALLLSFYLCKTVQPTWLIP